MKTPRCSATVVLSLAFGTCLAYGADWPGFRGSKGGVSDEKDLPVKWTKENVLWKVKMPGPGTSSPITFGDKIFLTAYSGYGTSMSKGMTGGFGGGFGGKDKGKGKGGFGKGGPDAGGDQKKLRLNVLCLNPKGETVWQKDIQPKLPEMTFSGFMREHGYASSTPITDGERLYVFFGKTGVFAFDLDGKQLWQADVGSETHMWGSAASPILYKDLVIVNAAIESKALIALDKKTGKEVWRTRGMGTSWASPLLVDTKDGKQEVVVSQPGKVVGYDPATGKELWQCQGIGGGGGGGFGGGKGGFGGGYGAYTCSTPVTRDGVVYVIGGGGPTPAAAFAVKAGGKGDVTKSHVLWRKNLGSSCCSPVLCGDILCWVSGTITGLGTADGKTVHQARLYTARGGSEYTSAVATGDTVFALSRFDGLYVVSRDRFKELSHYDFDGDSSGFTASPAISNGRIYIRSNTYLYCIGTKTK